MVIGALCLYGIYKVRKKQIREKVRNYFMFSIIFIHIQQNKSGYLLPYIIVTWICIVITIIFAIYLPIDWYILKILKNKIIYSYDYENEAQKEQYIKTLGIIYGVVFAMLATLDGLSKFLFENFFLYSGK